VKQDQHEEWAVPLGVSILFLLISCLALIAAGGWKWFAEFLTTTAASWAQALLTAVAIIVTGVIARSTERKVRLKEESQRRRDFRAVQAFLPEALSDLVAYLRASAEVLNSAFDAGGPAPAGTAMPALPNSVRPIFRDCIQHATPAVGEHLATILRSLQIHHARLQELVTGGSSIPMRMTILSYMYSLGEIKVMVNRLFPFARNDVDDFEPWTVEFKEFRTAYFNLDIDPDDVESAGIGTLSEFTKRRVPRLSSTFRHPPMASSATDVA